MDYRQKILKWLFTPKVLCILCRYVDGSVLAQMGSPDMRIPIACGLAYSERIKSSADDLQFLQTLNLTFDKPDRVRFPCLKLAEDAFLAGGTAPAILNAANEVAVFAFLSGDTVFIFLKSMK